MDGDVPCAREPAGGNDGESSKEKDPSHRVSARGEGSKAVTSTVAIVWPCPLDVDEYAAAGRDVEVPRPLPELCEADDLLVRVPTPRARRRRPAHLGAAGQVRPLPRQPLPAPRVLPVQAALWRALTREVAGASGSPYTTVRDWRRRHRDRAPVLAAGFAALAVELGGDAPELAAVPERAALAALEAAWATARSRYGTAVAARWRFWSVVSGGQALGTTTHTPWISVGGRRLIPPVP